MSGLQPGRFPRPASNAPAPAGPAKAPAAIMCNPASITPNQLSDAADTGRRITRRRTP